MGNSTVLSILDDYSFAVAAIRGLFFCTVIVMLYRCVYMIEGYSIACKQCCTSIQPYHITYQWYNSSKFSGYIDNQQWVLLFVISSRTRKSDYFPEGVYLCYRLVTKSKPAPANLQDSTILPSQQFALFFYYLHIPELLFDGKEDKYVFTVHYIESTVLWAPSLWHWIYFYKRFRLYMWFSPRTFSSSSRSTIYFVLGLIQV